MVVDDVAGECDLDLVFGAVAVKFATLEVRIALLDTVVDEWVDRNHDGYVRLMLMLSLEDDDDRKESVDDRRSQKVPATTLYTQHRPLHLRDRAPIASLQRISQGSMDGAIMRILEKMWVPERSRNIFACFGQPDPTFRSS